MLYMINDCLSTFSQKILGTHNSDFQSVNVKMLCLTIEFFLGHYGKYKIFICHLKYEDRNL